MLTGDCLSTDGPTVRLSPGLFQPIAADDVAAIVADVALAAPRNSIVEIAGPERAPFYEIVARYLKAIGDPRTVVSDPEARYFGGRVEERSLVPLGEARLGRIGLDEWLRSSQTRARSCIRGGHLARWRNLAGGFHAYRWVSHDKRRRRWISSPMPHDEPRASAAV
jgi:hypothetical protein